MKTLIGYMADSSWFNFPSGGRKYHLEGVTGSKCGSVPALAEFTAESWDKISDVLKCKRCIKTIKNNR